MAALQTCVATMWTSPKPLCKEACNMMSPRFDSHLIHIAVTRRTISSRALLLVHTLGHGIRCVTTCPTFRRRLLRQWLHISIRNGSPDLERCLQFDYHHNQWCSCFQQSSSEMCPAIIWIINDKSILT